MLTRQSLMQACLGLGFVITFISPALAQITPNGVGTLVNSQGNQINISGGTQAGGNLFHSFRDFNVNSSQVANFLSNPQIQNILARINGGNTSLINGLLQVTGGNSNLFLMNPAGIVFGQGASLNIPASFTATTANQIGFGNNLFNAFGDNKFSALIGNPDSFVFTTNQAGSIVNAGNLSVTPGQGISLIGGNVVNTGNINAGNITLAAVPGTNRVRISQPGHILSLEIVLPVDAVITPLDLPRLLTGSDLPGIISNSSTVQVAGVEIPTGQGINITSGNLGTFSQGGVINVLGDRVALVNANLNASGSNGGGTIRVGGEYRGGGVNPFNSRITYVDSRSFLNADAVNSGNGGRVIVWADDTTRFYGNISGRGVTGSGGFVEVSGKVNLAFDGRVELSGANGLNGTLLLDPTDIIIQAGAGNGDGSLPNIALGTLPDPMTISAGALAAVAPTTAIDIQASNNITFNVPVTFAACTTGTCGAISFTAGGLFNTNGNDIIASGRDFRVTAGSITAGNIDTSISTVLRNGGSISLIATNGNINTGNISAGSSVVNANSGNGGDVITSALNGSVSVGIINSRSAVSGNGNSANGGNIRVTANNGEITATAMITSSSPGVFIFGSRTLSGNAGNGGNITIDATNNVVINSVLFPDIDPTNLLSLDTRTFSLDYTPTSYVDATVAGNAFPVGTGAGNGGRIRVNQNITNNGDFVARGEINSTTNYLRLLTDVQAGAGSIRLTAGRSITTSVIDGESSINLNAGSSITNTAISGSRTAMLANSSININAGSSVVISRIVGGGIVGGTFLGSLNIEAGSNIDILDPDYYGTMNLRAGSNINNSRGIDTNGDVNLIAGGNINSGGIAAANFGPGNGSGWAVNLNAGGDINLTYGVLTASQIPLPFIPFVFPSFGNGGPVNLNAGGNITTGRIQTDSYSGGTGGVVNVVAGNLFRATGSITNRDNILASISTAGGSGGGSINITHGGSTSVPFVVGNATVNGTAAAITSGLGGNTINNLTVPVPPEVNTYGTNITIRTTAPTPIPAFLIPLLINPTPPPTPTAVVVGTPPPPPEPISQTTSASPVISTPVTTPVLTNSPNSVIPPVTLPPTPTAPTNQIITPPTPSPNPNPISPGTQSALATTLTILNSQNSLSTNLDIIDPNLQSARANNPAIPILTRIPTSSLENILRLLDDPFKEEFQAFTGIGDEIATLDVNQAQDILSRITKETNVKPAFIYVFFTPANDANARDRTVNSARTQLFRNPSNTDTLEVVLVPPTGDLVRVRYNALTRPEVLESAGELTRGVARRSVYGRGSRRMYDLIIAPLEEDLKRLKIDNLVFLMDAGLRSMPIAAMQSKDNRFIIEDYSVALMPSLTLTDTIYSSIKDSQVMAMGADRFVVDNLKPLPGVPVELKAINQIRGGNIFLNENFTLSNLRQNRRPEQRIVHLATHGSFYGDKVNSYIQLWGTERLTLEQIRASGFGTPPVDLLVLSACETALGNTDAELGFAGLAVTSGVRSALASLWQVSDEGTMGLMAEFYQQLQTTTTKSEALRQAQLAMLRGEVRLEGGSLVTPKGNFALNEELKKLGDRQLTHPFFWSAFTMIGNPW